MPKKPFPFTTMSDVVCNHAGCSKLIKMNLTTRKASQHQFKCFKHWMKNVMFERNRKKDRQ